MAAGIASAQDAKTAVETAEKKFNECVVKKDKACLTGLTTPEFTIYHSMEGRPLTAPTRDQFLTVIENQALTFQNVDEMKVLVLGDSAVATSRMRFISEGRRGASMTGSYLVTDVWVKSGGEWKLALRTAGHSEKASY